MNRWYVAGAHAGLEDVAKYRLSQQFLESYIPVYNEPLGGGRYKTRRLFPCYIFVELDLDGDGVQAPDWRAVARWVNSTRGVTKLLPLHLEKPLPLPVGFVEDLRLSCESGNFDPLSVEELARSYVKGQTVPIASGDFAGFSGPLSYYKKGCAVILLTLLGAQREVHIPLHQVVLPDVSGSVRQPPPL